MVLPVLGLLLATFPQGEKLISYSNQGAPTPVLLRELSASCGIQLTCAPFFAKDILSMRVEQVPLQQLLDKLAVSSLGKWEKTADGWNLTRSSDAERIDADQRRAREIALVQKELTRRRKMLQELPPWSEAKAKSLKLAFEDAQKAMSNQQNFDRNAWERSRQLDEQAPASRALTRILADFDAAELAALPTRLRVVYSDQPTKLQRRLPPRVASIVAELVKEQNLWSEIVGPPSEGDNVNYGSSLNYSQPFKTGVGKVLLALQKGNQPNGLTISFTLTAADKQGTIITTANSFFNTMENEGRELPKPEPGEKPFEISPIAKAFMKALGGLRGGQPPARVGDEVLQYLVLPEKFEPVALTAGEFVTGYSKAKRVNVIANLPDFAVFSVAFVGDQPVTPSLALKSLTFLGLQENKSDGWLLLLPQSFANQRTTRADRAVTGSYVRAMAAGTMDLDKQAAYAASTDGEPFESLGFMLGFLISPAEFSSMDNWTMLRLYGSLTQNQRNALRAHQPISLNALLPTQAKILDLMLFSGFPNLQPPPEVAENQEAMMSFYNGIRREPTELFGNGIPSDASLVMNDETREVVFFPGFDSNGQRYGAQAMDASAIASMMYAKERPGIMPWMDRYPSMDGMQLSYGKETTLRFAFTFPKIGSMQMELKDSKPANKATVTYDQLPQSFRDEVQKVLAEVRKNYANVKPGELGGQPGRSLPPPPQNG